MPEFVKMIGVLCIACSLAGGSLAVVNMVTKTPIAAWESKQKEAALREVFPNADAFESVKPEQQWKALKNGQVVGNVFLTEVQGYSGAITLMFGIAADQSITGLNVLSHTETPGLGAKITTTQFREQFKQKRFEQIALKKDASQGAIDGITAATISSRAVTRAVASTFNDFLKAQEGAGK